ncbi:helix-turn-helix domain-containing protein [Pseudenhygromyxa sp. WMMC2535]|uniref:helix-turn-helix domain-containing protein n=1 Tax=Pseudenhygromyxa sp. WMMC2535 TaxID=2712867 RepID=UPI001554FC35|nr:helix-turn-helix domain-containing protein [Pseudenhygromyxa sp. WMMC2535]NVB40919.1 helix-turn-helix domain-containing protein [Pseudenhygromyxa sp. WMMC2535]NVB40946.1 helix-turn-helix domain-containing protein [Pseudenhygromyxa sp. WMMC2535]NVB42810.1 helix-turn-helix domain-containing protein [Pseudenhygromyxa sp. WMMC2535]
MTTPISVDLRARIAEAIEAGEESQPLIAERFSVSVTTVERISRKLRQGESLVPKSPPGRTPKLKERHLLWIRGEMEKDPYLGSYHLSARFNRRFPKNRVHRSTILRALHQLGLSFKKNSLRSPAGPS